MILINGVEADSVAVKDRGFQYGDGLFETLEICRGKPLFLNQHFHRLTEGCFRLAIPCPDLGLLSAEINQLSSSAERAVLKLIITRGSGGRGYRQPDSILTTRVVSLHSYPDYPADYVDEGINTIFCQTRLGINPLLAGIKHLNRLEQIMARNEWQQPEIQEGIMLDINNYVIEGTMTNLFYSKDNTLYTAPVQASGVAGIMRSVIIALAEENNLPLIEQYYGKEDLLAADELFISNSIIGIWPVKQVENHYFAVGKTTQQLLVWLAELKQRELKGAA
jgi:4-amino-4-deoxychorismate lyase